MDFTSARPSGLRDATAGMALEGKPILRIPRAYGDWRLVEVVLPLVAGPILMYVFLLFATFINGAGGAWTHPVVAVMGTGDLLVFGALLVINVGAKYRAREDEEKLSRDINVGDTSSLKILTGGTLLLMIYAVGRVVMETSPSTETQQFIFSVFSAVLLVFILLWLDSLMHRMHIDIIEKDISARLIKAQYVSY